MKRQRKATSEPASLGYNGGRSIPQDIIEMLILPRLPVKSLVRFKLVSKHWESFISSYKFAKIHLLQHKNAPAIFIRTQPIPSVSSKLLLLKLESPDEDTTTMEQENKAFDLTLSKWEHGYQTPSELSMMEDLIGSCNGLLCIQFTNNHFEDDARFVRVTRFLLWNPLLNVRRTLQGPFVPHKSRIMSSGFGFDSSSDDYKIVVLAKPFSTSPLIIQLFSSRKDSWRKLTAPYFQLCERRTWVGRSVLVGETLYWLFLDLTYGSKLVAFDLKTESLSLVPLSDNFPKPLALCNVGGRLCVTWLILSSTKFSDMEVWMLEPEQEQQSWRKLFHFNNLDLSLWDNESDFVVRHLLELQGYEDKVFWLSTKLNHLVSISCEDGLNKVSQTSIPRGDYNSSLSVAMGYTESLVSPNYHRRRAPIAREAKMQHFKNDIARCQPIK